MNPELKALLDKYAAAGASDDELRHVAANWQAQSDAAQRNANPSASDSEALLRRQGLLGGPPAAAPTAPSTKPDVTSAEPYNRPSRLQGGDLQAALRNPGKQAAFVGRGLTANALNAAQGFPGVEAGEAGLMSLGSQMTKQPMGYKESLNTLRNQTEKIPAKIRAAEKMAVGGRYLPAVVNAAKMNPVTGALVSTPSRTAGTLAAADVMGQADPNVDAGQRLTEAATAVPSAMLLGKALSLGRTVGKAKASDVDQNLVNRDVARTEAAGPEYDRFRALGDLGQTPKLNAILGLPVIRRALRTVQSESPDLAALPATDASVLDAVYKRIGNKAFTAKFGFQTDQARTALKDAIDEAAQLKGGSYAVPVDTYHEHSQGIGGVERGRNALTNALGKSSSTDASLEDSPAALQRDLPTMPSNAQAGVPQGIYGQLRKEGLTAHLGRVPLPLPSRALMKGDALANQFDPQSTDALIRLLGITNAPVANP